MSDEVLVERRGAVQVGVLTGAGGTFSSGMDLKAFLKGETPSFPGRGLCGITQTPPRKPLIGAAEGWALAGGFELLLACDLVVAGASARFGVPDVKRGLVAGAGGALLLARRIPRALALEMILTGDPFDARRAAEIGLVNRVVDEGQALEAAMGLAEKIAANGPLALMASKEISNGGGDWTAEERWDDMARVMRPVFTSQDAQESARSRRTSSAGNRSTSSTARPGWRPASRPSSAISYRSGSAASARRTSASAAW